MKQSNTPSNTFKWLSQNLCEILDISQNNKLQITLESGYSIDPNSGMMNYLQSRVSFKIRNNNIGNTKTEIEFNYFELYELVSLINAVHKNTRENLEVSSHTKNKLRKLIINKNTTGYSVLIRDKSNVVQQLFVQISKLQFVALKSLLYNILSNWTLFTQNIHVSLLNQSIVTKLDTLQFNVNSMNFSKAHYSNFIDNDVSEINDNDNDEMLQNVEFENSKHNEMEFIEQHVEEIQETPVEADDIDVAFDAMNSEFKNNVEPHTFNLDNELKTILSDDHLSNIELDGKKFDYTKNKKVVNVARPFLNNFMNWNLNTLYDWVNGLILCDADSDDNTLKPLEMFLLKSIGTKNTTDLLNSKYIYQFQYEMISELKKFVHNSININNNTELYGAKKLKTSIYSLSDVKKIKRDENRQLWDFTIDNLSLFLLLRFFIHYLDLLKRNNLAKDSADCSSNKRFTCEFLYSYVFTLFDLLDRADFEEYGKEDIINVSSMMINHNMHDELNNCYSEITLGGKLNIDLVKLNEFTDKYIDIIYTKLKFEDFSEYYDEKFDHPNSIRESLLEFIKPIEKVDVKTKLLIDYIQSLEIPYDLTQLNSIDFNDIDKQILPDVDTVHVVYNIIKFDNDITTIKQINKKLNEIEAEKVNTPTPEPNETENIRQQMWDIDGDDDESLMEIFS